MIAEPTLTSLVPTQVSLPKIRKNTALQHQSTLFAKYPTISFFKVKVIVRSCTKQILSAKTAKTFKCFSGLWTFLPELLPPKRRLTIRSRHWFLLTNIFYFSWKWPQNHSTRKESCLVQLVQLLPPNHREPQQGNSGWVRLLFLPNSDMDNVHRLVPFLIRRFSFNSVHFIFFVYTVKLKAKHSRYFHCGQ